MTFYGKGNPGAVKQKSKHYFTSAENSEDKVHPRDPSTGRSYLMIAKEQEKDFNRMIKINTKEVMMGKNCNFLSRLGHIAAMYLDEPKEPPQLVLYVVRQTKIVVSVLT